MRLASSRLQLNSPTDGIYPYAGLSASFTIPYSGGFGGAQRDIDAVLGSALASGNMGTQPHARAALQSQLLSPEQGSCASMEVPAAIEYFKGEQLGMHVEGGGALYSCCTVWCSKPIHTVMWFSCIHRYEYMHCVRFLSLSDFYMWEHVQA